MADVAAFEAAFGVILPADYRCFITTIGNGGAGPYYGLDPLEAFGRDLSRPFPFTQSSGSVVGPDQRGRGYEFPGVLEFCHRGCDNYSYLVVAGPAYGTVWDGCPEDDDFRPTGLSFADWYGGWASRALRLLENERLVLLLREGMSKAEVIARVGGTWNERKALYRSVWYLESADVPAQLELDERGVVIKVAPWPFIVAAS